MVEKNQNAPPTKRYFPIVTVVAIAVVVAFVAGIYIFFTIYPTRAPAPRGRIWTEPSGQRSSPRVCRFKSSLTNVTSLGTPNTSRLGSHRRIFRY